MIAVHDIRDPFNSERRTHWEIPTGQDVRSLAPDWFDWDNVSHVCVKDGGVHKDPDEQAGPSSCYTFKVRPRFLTAGAQVASFLGIGAGAGATTSLLAAKVFGGILAFGTLRLISKILLPSRKPAGEVESSATYGFRNLQGVSRGEGSARQVIYGTHRVEPVLIGRYIRTTPNPATTTLFLLYHIGEGPLSKIGGRTTDGDNLLLSGADFPTGVQLNNQPAENFDGLEAWVRMGGLNQTAIPGFEDTRLTQSVGQTLLEPSDIPNFLEVTIPGVYTTGSGTITNWDDYGSVVSYTAGDSAEQFTYIVTFPNGLFEVSSGSGNYLPRSVEFQARYIEVDGGGTPTGDYVVLPKEPPVTNNKAGAFSVAFTHDFLDPGSSVSFGDQNEYLTLAAGEYSYAATPSGYVEQVDSDTEISVLVWLRPAISGLSFSDTHLTIADQLASNQGWRFEIREGSGPNPNLNFPSGTTLGEDARFMQVQLGDGSTVNSYNNNNYSRIAFTQSLLDPDPLGTGNQKMTQCVFTYKANVDDEGNGRVRLYYDATLARELKVPATFRPVINASADLSVGARDSSGTPAGNNAGGFDIQELLYYQRELSEFDILAKYNSYKPFEAKLGEPGLIGGWHFDADYADFISSNDLSSGTGGTFSGGVLGPVKAAPVGTIKKSTYKVEVQRITADETEPLKQSASDLDFVELTTFQEFQYPGSALMALKIPATDQLNTTQPLVTVKVDEGRLCPVWDQADANVPAYTLQYTKNPAWVIADMLTNRRYGLGAHYSFSDLNVASFQEFADWCDEYAHDGRGQAGQDYSKNVGALLYDAGQQRALVSLATANVPANWLTSLKIYDSLTGSRGTLFKLENFAGSSSDEYNSSHNVNGDFPGVVELVNIGFGAGFFTYSFDVSGYDNLALTGPITTGITSGAIYPVEKRMEFDGVFDEQDASAWDAILSVAQSARAVPIRIGSRISIFYDDTRAATALVTMGNVVADSFELTYGSGDNPNTVVAEYFDRDKSYERQTVRYEDPDLQDPSSFSTFRVESKQLRGVTRRSQAERHIRRDVNAYRLLKKGCRFEQFVDAITYRVGDRIQVAHDLPQWGESGRCLKDASAATEIYLDREVTLGGGSYEITVRDAASGTIETVTVSSGAGTYAVDTALTIAALGWTPQEDDIYSLAEAGQQVRDFTVVDLSMRPDSMRTRVECIEYDANVYSDDFGDLDDVTVAELPPQNAAVIPGSPKGILASSAIASTIDGSTIPAIDVTWTYDGDEAVGGTRVWVEDSQAGAGFMLAGQAGAEETNIQVAPRWLRVGRRYRVKLQPVSSTGEARGLGMCPQVPLYLREVTGVPAGPTSLTARISGQRAVYRWSGGEPDRARAVELRRGGWILGLPVANATGSSGEAQSETWAAVADAAHGATMPPVRCRYRTGLGHFSDEATTVLTERVQGDTIIYDVEEADGSFGGTLTDLQVESAPSSPELWPLEDRGPKLKFTGASLTATYEFTVSGTAAATYVYSQLVVDAVQVHPYTTASGIGGSATGDLDMARWTAEGPVHTYADETGNCSILVELAHSQRSTAGSDYREYRDGLFYSRSMAFRITVTRPNTDYDVRIRRIALRLSKQPSRRTDVAALNLYQR